MLVFENVDMKTLLKQREIDPHFLDDKRFISPIARFNPTEEGWQMALKLVATMNPNAAPKSTRKSSRKP